MSQKYAITTPYRYEVVGSFLRPEVLKKARADFETGTITREQLTEVEDQCIRDLVSKQKKAGLRVITDGEFRRSSWHLDFMWGFPGVAHAKTDTGLPFHDETAMLDDTFLVGRISAPEEHPFVRHFRFMKTLEDETCVVKQTLPSPAQMLAQFIMPFNREHTDQVYADHKTLISDLTEAYAKVVLDLYDAGCRNVQFDDCTWGMIADSMGHILYGTTPEGMKEVQRIYKDINNAVIRRLPADMTVNTHVCRGNFHSTYANSGPYDSVAEILFGEENVHAYFLEFDDERSGGFEPLKYVSGNKLVVLGLITTKRASLENRSDIIERIHEAAKYVPLERLCLSPQCGFASCEVGNKLTEAEQWAKIELVKSIAEEVWGN